MGQVCQKHQEFYETECRWCPPPQKEYRLDTTMRYAAPKTVVVRALIRSDSTIGVNLVPTYLSIWDSLFPESKE